jgi:hypothetical protein
MAGLNTVALAQVHLPVATTAILKSRSADTLQAFFANVVVHQQSAAPILEEIPNRVDKVYPATDGNVYFIPQARIAGRPNRPDQVDIFIDRQADTYTLQVTFDLVHHPNTLAATALPLDGFSVNLNPQSPGKTIAFTQVQALPAPANQTTVLQQLFAQTQVDVNTILAILQSETDAWFEVRADTYYRLQVQPPTPPTTPPPTTPPPIPRPPIRIGTIGGSKLMTGRPPLHMEMARVAETTREAAIAPAMINLASINKAALRIDPTFFRLPPPPRPTDVRPANVALMTASKDGLKGPFPPTNPANRPIYAKVDPNFGADSDWAQTAFGFIKDSEIPNHFYILPDSYGLAFDAASGLPDMSVLLHSEADPGGGPAVYRVRVRFVVMPRLDATRLQNLRKLLRDEQGIAYADLVIGGYDKALFTPTHLFDQLGSTVVAGASDSNAQPVDASGAFELVLDCTMEFYTLLSKLLVTPDSGGLTGTVAIALKKPDKSVEIPVQLRLDRTANHPLTIKLATEAASEKPADTPDSPPVDADAPAMGPNVVIIDNPSQVQVTVEQVLPTLLVMDEHMPYACLAATAVPAPTALDLAAGKLGVQVTLTPPDSFPLWGAVAVDFGNPNIKLDAAKVLDRIHELATSANLNTSVRVWSFLLQHPDQIPQSLAGLVGIHVQIRKGSGTPVDVRLVIGTAEQTVRVAFTFADLVAGMSPDQPTFQYRCRNIVATGEAESWGDWQTNTGGDLLVFPQGV